MCMHIVSGNSITKGVLTVFHGDRRIFRMEWNSDTQICPVARVGRGRLRKIRGKLRDSERRQRRHWTQTGLRVASAGVAESATKVGARNGGIYDLRGTHRYSIVRNSQLFLVCDVGDTFQCPQMAVRPLSQLCQRKNPALIDRLATAAARRPVV